MPLDPFARLMPKPALSPAQFLVYSPPLSPFLPFGRLMPKPAVP